MEQLISAIATAGNLAVLVLMVVCGGMYLMLREERRLEREARKEDALHCARATDRQTEAVEALTEVLTQLRVDSAKRRTG